MQVTAISYPDRSGWLWRITDYSGNSIEESREAFGSISAAVAAGTQRMTSLNVTDRSDSAVRPWTTRQGGWRRGRRTP
jgi:hypothetical protein